MKILKGILEFIFYSNIYVGLCAVCMALSANFFWRTQPEPTVFLFIFCATVGAYSLLKLLPVYLKTPMPDETGYTFWARNNFQYALSILFTSLTIALTCFLFFDSLRKIFVLLAAAITVLYAFPFFFKFNLRQIGILKPLFVAIVWTIVTHAITHPFNFSDPESLLAGGVGCVPVLLFVLPLCIVYEVKDMKDDTEAGLNTLPLIFSAKTTMKIALAICLLSLSALVTLIIISKSPEFKLIAAVYATPFLLSTIAVSLVKETTHEFYYLGIIDGMMILQFLILHFTLGVV